MSSCEIAGCQLLLKTLNNTTEEPYLNVTTIHFWRYKWGGHLARFHPIIAKREFIFIVLCCSLGSYQSEGESSRPPSGRRLTPIDNAPQITVADSVIPTPPSGPVSLKLSFFMIVTSRHSELLPV